VIEEHLAIHRSRSEEIAYGVVITHLAGYVWRFTPKVCLQFWPFFPVDRGIPQKAERRLNQPPFLCYQAFGEAQTLL
jgi:hypothetical protein